MNDRINDLAVQLAEELEKHEKQHGSPKAFAFKNIPTPDEDVQKPSLAKVAATLADVKVRLRIVDMVFNSELEIKDTDTLQDVLETIYDFVAAYEVE